MFPTVALHHGRKGARCISDVAFSFTSTVAIALAIAAGCCVPSLGAAETVAWPTDDLPSWPTPLAAEAIVTEGVTDIQWVPEAYAYTPGPSLRYVDFEHGDDSQAGTSVDTAWKHHPWDAAATGVAAATEGVQTYVFKGGVIYRGQLIADESGTTSEPIRLCSDPQWGTGPATIAGSVALTGWQAVSAADAEAAGFPAAAQGQLVAVTVPGAGVPRAVWRLNEAGERQRMNLARWPNWQIEHPYDHFTQWFRIDEAKFKFPWISLRSDDLKGADRDALKGVTVWADHPNKSGEFSIYGPFPSPLKGFNPADGSFQVRLEHPARHPRKDTPFFLENSAHFLDEPGEWFFDQGERRLSVWLPEGVDPASVVLEAAVHEIILDIHGQQHIVVGGLTFTGANVQDLRKSPDVEDYNAPKPCDVNSAIRLLGNCQDIELYNLRVIDTTGGAVTNLITGAEDVVRGITIRDSEFERIDTTGISLGRGYSYRRVESHPKGRLTEVNVLRNRFQTIGLRSHSSGSGNGINLSGPEVCDIAGNVIHTTGGQGINVVGGRPSAAWMGGNAADTPLVRIQIRSNKVVDSLIYRTDFGGIEFWGNGPAYIYNNISANPVGFVAHRKVYHKNEAFYQDHGIKAYLFNNIGWSERRDDAYKGIVGDAFINGIRNRLNQVFHNTGYCFRNGQRHSSRHGEQQHVLGNVFEGMHFSAISSWTLLEAPEIAYSNNVVGNGVQAVFSRWRGAKYVTPDEFAAAIAEAGNNITSSMGWVTDDPITRDPEQRDFRLTDTSAAIDRGVQVFVPWSLSGQVGEWHFRKHPADPQTVLGYDVYMQKLFGGQRQMLGGAIPGNDLVATGYTLDDYRAGPLEDWVDGALQLDGKRVLRLAQQQLVKDMVFEKKKGKEVEKTTVDGSKRQTVRMDTNNFLIEAVLTVSADGVLAGKLGTESGYALVIDGGRPAVRLIGGGSELRQLATVRVDDGVWHHVLAEIDRVAGRVTVYVDGKDVTGDASGQMPAASVSLDNTADFVVGDGFAGALDYLRVARGTLADAQTDIDELMTWQFNGPQLHDFAGHAPNGQRDAGALENLAVTGQRPIRYTPPEPEEDVEKEVEASTTAKVFKDGPERTVKAFDWGSVSVPKEAAPGDTIDFQVVFGTETIAKQQILRVDLHGFNGGKRKPGVGGSGHKPKIVPGVTTPYEAPAKMPAGYERIAVVFYVSPDGSYANRTLGGSVTVDVKAK
ncbi:MAG: LamG domain-containing protein [Planctomycetota bacterium]|jgi:hypothetical protein|nr:LamG domain-containing protein [Planctomycetota bacterium]